MMQIRGDLPKLLQANVAPSRSSVHFPTGQSVSAPWGHLHGCFLGSAIPLLLAHSSIETQIRGSGTPAGQPEERRKVAKVASRCADSGSQHDFPVRTYGVHALCKVLYTEVMKGYGIPLWSASRVPPTCKLNKGGTPTSPPKPPGSQIAVLYHTAYVCIVHTVHIVVHTPRSVIEISSMFQLSCLGCFELQKSIV